MSDLFSGLSRLLEENPELAKLAESLFESGAEPLSLLGSAPAPPDGEGRLRQTVGLLEALKPFLSPKRAETVDRALRMLSAAQSIRALTGSAP